MLRIIILIGFIFLFNGQLFANKVDVMSKDFVKAVGLIEQQLPAYSGKMNSLIVNVDDHNVSFETRLPLKFLNDIHREVPLDERYFSVNMIFNRQSHTIDKRIRIRENENDLMPDKFGGVRLRFTLIRPESKPLEQTQAIVKGQTAQVYYDKHEYFFYIQTPNEQTGEVELKEWIYATTPNVKGGSQYQWSVVNQEFKRRVVVIPDANGGATIERQMVVKGVEAHDYEEQRRIIKVINQVLPNIYISGEDQLGRIEPVVYWTRDGVKKRGKLTVNGHNQLTVSINEPANAYPLLIDPTIVLQQ